jgi:hypothetical protein
VVKCFRPCFLYLHLHCTAPAPPPALLHLRLHLHLHLHLLPALHLYYLCLLSVCRDVAGTLSDLVFASVLLVGGGFAALFSLFSNLRLVDCCSRTTPLFPPLFTPLFTPLVSPLPLATKSV